MALWWKLISNGATIAELAKTIFNTVSKDKATAPPPSNDIRDLLYRLDYLEKNEVKQAELIKRMAEQMNDMSSKIKTANILAIISIIVAAISIVSQLLNK
jgi:hypothetical protein